MVIIDYNIVQVPGKILREVQDKEKAHESENNASCTLLIFASWYGYHSSSSRENSKESSRQRESSWIWKWWFKSLSSLHLVQSSKLKWETCHKLHGSSISQTFGPAAQSLRSFLWKQKWFDFQNLVNVMRLTSTSLMNLVKDEGSLPCQSLCFNCWFLPEEWQKQARCSFQCNLCMNNLYWIVRFFPPSNQRAQVKKLCNLEANVA